MKSTFVFLVLLSMIGTLSSCVNTNNELYNCYAVSYVAEFGTFITIPISENTKKKESEAIIKKEIENSVKSTENQKFVKTIQLSENSTETLGSGLIRYFCFPSEVDNDKNNKSVSDFINGLDNEPQHEKINSIFPL
ncbi:MAG: hypothetical protein LBE97_02245 [Holosporales bacterium]|jgi:hypothetical protein|nr:hypothetical protein [Holosporales bacterium]